MKSKLQLITMFVISYSLLLLNIIMNIILGGNMIAIILLLISVVPVTIAHRIYKNYKDIL